MDKPPERDLFCVDGPLSGRRYKVQETVHRLIVWTPDGNAIYDVEHSRPSTNPDWFQMGWKHPWGDGPEPEPVYWLQFFGIEPFVGAHDSIVFTPGDERPGRR